MKKKWEKPELIELYRGRPDENLLEAIWCKAGVPDRNSPDNAMGIYCQFEHGSRIGQPCYTYNVS